MREDARAGEAIVRRLSAHATLSATEIALLRRPAERRERFAPGAEVAAEGAPPGHGRFLASGWIARQRVLPDGRRQIFGLALPGDGLGLAGRLAGPAPFAMVAVTPVELIDAEAVREAALRPDEWPGLSAAVEGARRQAEAMLLDHIVRLGRQTAYERTAHFLLEMRDRLQAVGLADERRFPLPVTQEMLADVLGLSMVHMNRTLQQLRREGLIELRGGAAILLQPHQLAAIGDYRRVPRRAA